MNTCINTLILENCALLAFKWCFNFLFEKQLWLITFPLLSVCWKEAFVHKRSQHKLPVALNGKFRPLSHTGPMYAWGTAQQEH